ncbi:TatD family hydrolase [Micromonospora sp. M12]
MRHFATIALNPSEANDPRCRPVLDLLPRYLDKDAVVAVGEIGYDSMTPEEDEAFAAQLALAVAYDLPALVHTPHRDKARGCERPRRGRRVGHRRGSVVVDHLNEVTVKLVRDSGCWLGFSIYPTPR